MGRFLRGKKARALVFFAAKGCCALCGEPLRPGWHADHRLEWCITHQTNLHEMQATHPECNLRKELERRARERTLWDS